VAGLQYDVSAEGLAGLDVRLHGFSDKLPALTETVFKALAGFQARLSQRSRRGSQLRD
jgi:secreted Zn-dependent insulinase-like peptidase